MNLDRTVAEALAAELTAAAYPVALRHGVGAKWLDLELELWQVLAETLQRWERQIAQAADQPEITRRESLRPLDPNQVSSCHA